MKHNRQDQYYQTQASRNNQKAQQDEELEEEEYEGEEEETGEAQKTGKWTSEEDELLRKYVPLFGEKQWRKIAEYIPGRSSIQCLHRWTKILKPGLIKGPWTQEEDQKLIAWVAQEGPNKWTQASAYIKGRSGKQCRERWFNNLNPDVKKGGWTEEEDEKIFEYYQTYGSSWSRIAKLMPGRTENAIKNRFYSTLRKIATDKKKMLSAAESFGLKEESGGDDMAVNLQDKRNVEIPSYNAAVRQPPMQSNNPVSKRDDLQMNRAPQNPMNRETNDKGPGGLYKLMHHQIDRELGVCEEEQQPYMHNVKQEPNMPMMQQPIHQKDNMMMPNKSSNKFIPQTFEPQPTMMKQHGNFPSFQGGNAEYMAPKQANYNRTGYEPIRTRPPQQINIQMGAPQKTVPMETLIENDSELEEYLMELEVGPEHERSDPMGRIQYRNGKMVPWRGPNEGLVHCYENGDVRGTYHELNDLHSKIMSYCKDNIQQEYRTFVSLNIQELHNQGGEHDFDTRRNEMHPNALKKVKELPVHHKKESNMKTSFKEPPSIFNNLDEMEPPKEANSKKQKQNKQQSFSPRILSNPPKTLPGLKVEAGTEPRTRKGKEKSSGYQAVDTGKLDLNGLQHDHLPNNATQSFTPRNKKDTVDPSADQLQLGKISSNLSSFLPSMMPGIQKKTSNELPKPAQSKPSKNDNDNLLSGKLDLLPQLPSALPTGQPQLDLLAGLSGPQGLLGGLSGLASGLAGMLPGQSRGIADMFSGFKLGGIEKPKEDAGAAAQPDNIGNLYQMVNSMMSDPNSNGEDKISFLFKQLYSLENLLSSTRVELAQLETTIRDDQGVPIPQPSMENELKINFGQLDPKDIPQNDGSMNLWNLLLKGQKP